MPVLPEGNREENEVVTIAKDRGVCCVGLGAQATFLLTACRRILRY